MKIHFFVDRSVCCKVVQSTKFVRSFEVVSLNIILFILLHNLRQSSDFPRVINLMVMNTKKCNFAGLTLININKYLDFRKKNFIQLLTVIHNCRASQSVEQQS